MLKAHRKKICIYLCLIVFLNGCSSLREKIPFLRSDQAKRAAVTAKLRSILSSGRLPAMRWPDFSDYQQIAQRFYAEREYQPAWVGNDKPTSQAMQIIQALQSSEQKGLNPEDYDSSRWAARINSLPDKSSRHADHVAEFEAALTISAMRFISTLHNGRVNPQHFNFDINVQRKRYDLSQFVAKEVVGADDISRVLRDVEPQSDAYLQTENALQHYLELAKQDHAAPLPSISRPLHVGDAYPGVKQLWERLQFLGDPAGAATAASQETYDDQLSNAVKRFQHRHGLTEDGNLTPQVIAELNTPLWQRVHQLQDALERWRWLPENYLQAPLLVNLPEFVLRAYSPDHKLEFKMNIVVGQAIQEHRTPIFTDKMSYLIFRPYWNVPKDIAKKEILPHLEKDKHYLSEKNFEVADQAGNVVSSWTADQILSGGLIIREKPGPQNSLGLVKFMFPNQYDIYLHGTPAMELFSNTRRDFSHGCIRVQEPDKLAAWLLRDKPEWPLDKIQDAMNNGPDNQQVNLKPPVPVTIFYITAIVDEDGQTHFFDDIYGYDRELEASLAKGYPYPSEVEAIHKITAGDTR